MKSFSAKAKRRLKCVLLLIAVCLVIPVLQVGCVAFVNPPTTGPMVLRWVQGKLRSASASPDHFQWVDLTAVPENFLTCVWQSEDRHFFGHWGFDWEEIQKAREEAIATGKPARGASTITQQCARSLFLWQGRSWVRKGLEAYYTMFMELLLPKRRILELYVNVIELADGVYGIEAGAQHHFHASASQLTREQAAMLVAIMPNPKQLNPNEPSDRVLKRQVVILERSQNMVLPIETKK